MLYISDSHLPSSSANSLQVLANVECFNSVGLQTSLVAIGNVDTNNLPFKLHLLRFVSVKGYLYLYLLFCICVAFIKREKVIFTRFYLAAVIFPRLGFKTFYEIHSDYWNFGFFSKKVVVKSFSKLEGVISISKNLKRKFESDFPAVAESNILVAPDGSYKNPYKKDNHHSGSIQIGYSGSFKEGKGSDIVMGLADFLDHNRYVIHLIGGEKPVGSKDHKHLIFHGWKSYNETQKMIASFDILLIPNSENVITGKQRMDIGSFTSPLKMFDYMAAGKPIIASDLDILKEVLNNENCLLVPANDMQSWVAAIEELAEDKVKSKRLAKQAYHDFISHYTWEKRAININNFIQDKIK